MTEKKIRISVRLSQEDYDHAADICARAGLSFAKYFRALIRGSRIVEKPSLEYNALTRQLSAIGNAINQIARIANTTGYIHVDALEQHYAEVSEMLIVMRRGFIESG